MPKKSGRKQKMYGGTNVNIEHMTELQFGLSELQAILQNPFKNLLAHDNDIKKLNDIYNEDIEKKRKELVKFTGRQKFRKTVNVISATHRLEVSRTSHFPPESQPESPPESQLESQPPSPRSQNVNEMDDIQKKDEDSMSLGGKLKVHKKRKKRKLKGGTGEYNYTIDQVLSVWHLFDKYHDFIEYSLFTKDKEKAEIERILGSDYEDMQKLYDNACEAKNVHILLKHLRANSDTPLSSLMIYYRIYSSASNKTNALVKYSIPTDATSVENDLKINDTPTYLRELLSSKTNYEGTQQGTPQGTQQGMQQGTPQGTQQGMQKMTMIYDTNLNLSIPSSSSSGTSDQHIWSSFKKDILEQIGTQRNPFAKIWDPHGQSEPDVDDVNPCKGTDDQKKQKKDIIEKVYNTARNNDDKQNYNAFRSLTQNHFKIESACSGDNYIGIRIIFKKISNGNAQNINSDYNVIIGFIKNNGISEFKFEDYENHLSVIIKSNGFSKEIIAKTIKKMNTDLNDTFFQDENKFKEFCEIKKSDTVSYNVKLLALLLIAHVYISESNKEDLKLVFFDFKKSGDWGQVIYCKELKPKGCFISMDRYSALYSIMHNVPTVFLSTMLYHDPEKHKRDYCEVGIYMTDRKIDMAYIRRLLCDYARSVLFTKFMNIEGIGINESGHDCILNVFVNHLITEIKNSLSQLPQTDSKDILKHLLKRNDTGKNILQRIFTLYLDTIIRIFNALLTQFSITSDYIDEFYMIKRIQLNGFLSQISKGMNVDDTTTYNSFFDEIRKYFNNQIDDLFNDPRILQIMQTMQPEHKHKPRSSTSSRSPMSTGSTRSSTSPRSSMSTGSPKSVASTNMLTKRHELHIRPTTPTQQGHVTPIQGPVTPTTQVQTGPIESPALSDISQADTTMTSPEQNVEMNNDLILMNLINDFKKILDDLFDLFYIIYYYFICDDENNINVFLHHYVKNVFLLFFDTSCTIRSNLNTSSKPAERFSRRHQKQNGEVTVDVNPVQESLRNSCTTSISHLRSSAESAINTVPSGDKIADLKTKYNKLLQIYEIFLNDFNTSVSRLHFELFHKIGFLYKNSQSEQSSIIHSFYKNLCIQIKTILDNKIDDFFITKSESTNNQFHIHVINFIAENLESARHEEEDISIDTISFNNINDFLLIELKQIHDKIKLDFEKEKEPILDYLIDKEFANKKKKVMDSVLEKVKEMQKIYTEGITTEGGGKNKRGSDNKNTDFPASKKFKQALPDKQGQSTSRSKTSKSKKKQQEEQKERKTKLDKIVSLWRKIEKYIMLFENNKKDFKRIIILYFIVIGSYDTNNHEIPKDIRESYEKMLETWKKDTLSDIEKDIIKNKLSFEKVFDEDKYKYIIAQINGIKTMIEDSIKGIK
jgi:hypothetical protein